MEFRLFLGSFLCMLSVSTTMASEPTTIAIANEKFGKSLYKIITEKPGNLICSPFSAHVVLSMAYAGADGSTADAFSKVLAVPNAVTAANEYEKLLNGIKKIQNVDLKVANKIFLMKKYSLNPKFKQITSKQYDSEAQEIDFTKSQQAADTINGWVEDKTNHKIQKLIDPGSLDGLTRLVLVNAVYFKGTWEKKFDPANTKEEPFYLANGQETKCNMMHLTDKFHYGEDSQLNAKVLRMNYHGGDVSMLIFLPNERDGLAHLESNLHKVDFANYDKNLHSWEVNVALPKFKIESEIPLNEPLKKMGLDVIFSSNANFSNMITQKEDLYVSEVIQKAFIEVNEEGATAAAATGMIMMTRCMPLPVMKKTFTADHPFMIALISNQNIYLFIGKVHNVDA